MDKANHATSAPPNPRCRSDYDARHKGNLFLANTHWSIVGFMLLPAAMLAVGAGDRGGRSLCGTRRTA